MAMRSFIFLAPVALLAILGAACGAVPDDVQTSARAPSVHVIDLTHQSTTFEPNPGTAADERFAADMMKPVGASQPVAAFSDQMVLIPEPNFPTGDGVFKLTCRHRS